MELIPLAAIHRELKAALPPEFVASFSCWLVPSLLSEAQITDFEQKQNVILPPRFRAFIQTFDLSDFEIGPVFFGYSAGENNKTYLDVLAFLNTNSFHHSTSGTPDGFLCIAGTDGHTVLLNAADDTIFARDNDSEAFFQIAFDIEFLVRGAATLFRENVRTQKCRGNALAVSGLVCGSSDNPFWLLP